MSHVELRIESTVAGATRRWAIYAIPSFGDGEVERVECTSLDELDILLSKLRSMGMSELAVINVRKQVGERNVSYRFGFYDLSQENRDVLGLEPVTGLTRSELDALHSDKDEEEKQ